MIPGSATGRCRVTPAGGNASGNGEGHSFRRGYTMRSLIAGVIAVMLVAGGATISAPASIAQVSAPAVVAQAGRVTVEFWHGLTRPLGDILEGIGTDFNNSQTRYRVVSSFKGAYPETMQAAIAAFRAGNAPHIVQMIEVGTATMRAAGAAIKPVYQLFKETGVPFDTTTYLPAVRGYYSDAAGRMVGMPFNSSTPVLWYNK